MAYNAASGSWDEGEIVEVIDMKYVGLRNAADAAALRINYQLFILAVSSYALIALAAVTFLPLSEQARRYLTNIDTGICVLFLFDFVVSLKRSRKKLNYLATWGWLDLLSSIPIMPLRWARAARVVRILRVLRGVRATRVLTTWAIERRAESVLLAAILSAFFILVLAGLSVLQFEASHPNGNIKTAGDALWWGLVTVTTVGYGDKYPVTAEGRLMAVFLMLAGVGLFGTLSGAVAAWFLGPRRVTQAEQAGKREPDS